MICKRFFLIFIFSFSINFSFGEINFFEIKPETILYKSIDKFIPSLNENDYELDEKQRTCNLTDTGIENIEKALRADNIIKEGNLFDIKNISKKFDIKICYLIFQ